MQGCRVAHLGFGTLWIRPLLCLPVLQNTTVHGIFWGSYMMAQTKVLQDSMAQVLQWVQQGKLKVQVSHRFPLQKAGEAFRVILGRKAMGKVLLDVQPVAKL